MRFEESPEPFISTPTPPPLPGGQPPPPQRRGSGGGQHEPRRPRSGGSGSEEEHRSGGRRSPQGGGEGTPAGARGGERPGGRPPRRPEDRERDHRERERTPGGAGEERPAEEAAPTGRPRGERRERGERTERGEREGRRAGGGGPGGAGGERRGRRGDGRKPTGPRDERPGGGGTAAPGTDQPAATGTATGAAKTPATDPKPVSAAPGGPAAAPAAPVGFLEELGGDLLASVSRSFYLTIRLLPEPLRGPISLGYLLARAMDTIADSPAESTPAQARLTHLRALVESIKYGADPAALRPISRDLARRQKHAGERILLEKIERCLAWLESLEPVADRWDLQRALTRIAYGQELDLLRFGEGQENGGIKALQTARELDDYTYFVAGSAGELWTRLCGRHLPEYATLPQEEMLRLGRRFGQGLQLVNVLRDVRGDLSQGRCYLPAEELIAAGIASPADLLQQPPPAAIGPVLARWRTAAAERLDDAWRYVRALRGKKLRYACALPVLLGIRTLALIAQTSPLTAEKPVKVTRGNLRNIMFTAGVGMVAPALTDAYYQRARRQATRDA